MPPVNINLKTETVDRVRIDPMTSAICEYDITLRYISLRARKVPKLKKPAFIWLKDRAKGGRGPSSYHQEFLSALLEVAGAVFVVPNHVTEGQQEEFFKAAISTGCSVVILTTSRCVEEWEKASKLKTKHRSTLGVCLNQTQLEN